LTGEREKREKQTQQAFFPSLFEQLLTNLVMIGKKERLNH